MPEQNREQKKSLFKRKPLRRKLPKPRPDPILSKALDEAFKNAGQIYVERSLKGPEEYPLEL